jgi:hypothetical protein
MKKPLEKSIIKNLQELHYIIDKLQNTVEFCTGKDAIFFNKHFLILLEEFKIEQNNIEKNIFNYYKITNK